MDMTWVALLAVALIVAGYFWRKRTAVSKEPRTMMLCPQCDTPLRRGRFKCSNCEYEFPRYWRMHIQSDRADKIADEVARHLPAPVPPDLPDRLRQGLSFSIDDFEESNRIREALMDLGVGVGVEEKRRWSDGGAAREKSAEDPKAA